MLKEEGLRPAAEFKSLSSLNFSSKLLNSFESIKHFRQEMEKQS